MEFEDQLKKAISRGKSRGESARAEGARRQLSQEELRRKHTDFRLALSDYIEQSLRQVATHFPGFEYETVYGERGWGGAISRDDLMHRGSFYSRLEIVVRPHQQYNVVSLVGKATIKNREIANWDFFQEIETAALNEFQAKIDSWVLSYAEQFAAR